MLRDPEIGAAVVFLGTAEQVPSQPEIEGAYHSPLTEKSAPPQPISVDLTECVAQGRDVDRNSLADLNDIGARAVGASQTKLPDLPFNGPHRRVVGQPHSSFPRAACTPSEACDDEPHSASPLVLCDPVPCCEAEISTSDQKASDDHYIRVTSDLTDVPAHRAPQVGSDIGEIIIHHRRYEDLRRAHQRIDLQTKAIIRFAGDSAPVELWLDPYRAAMAPLESAIKMAEKDLAKLAKKLPVYEWAKSVSGLSDRFLALVVGEAGRPVTDYHSVAALWKRMGLAVIDGGRQRRVTGDAALLHGYVARRRALMWNIGESILKQQIRKNENGERYAKGEYGQVYIDRRAYEVETKGEKYSHARAKRYMEKRLLRELWKAWRDAA